MRRGISVAFFPTLWEVGYVRVRRKDVWAFGPFRFSIHRVTRRFKEYGR